MAPHTHEVLRAIPGPEGQPIPAGSLVDASAWKNTRGLEGDDPFSSRVGYLRRLKGGETPKRAAPRPPKPAAEPAKKASSKKRAKKKASPKKAKAASSKTAKGARKKTSKPEAAPGPTQTG